MHKLICLLLALLLAGCTAIPQENTSSSAPASTSVVSGEEQAAPYLSLAWFPQDGANPYLTTNQYTRQLAMLLYTNLTDISPSMEIEYTALSLARTEGSEVTLNLKPDIRFSDGTAATGQDLAASLAAAAQSGLYAKRFANMQGAALQEDGTVLVTLHEPDANFAWLLDIPLLKAEQVEESMPLSSGRYVLAGTGLVRNPYSGDEAGPEEIHLYTVNSYEELLSAFTGGHITFVGSEAEGDILGGSVAAQSYYATNTLVFLGVRAEGILAQPEMRAALSGLIDREEITQNAFFGRAEAAQTLLRGEAPANTASLAQALDEQGYALLDGYYHDAGGEPLIFTITYHAGSGPKTEAAYMLADTLAGAGIACELVPVADLEQYRQKIESGDYSLYIGEVKLYNNMDFSPFFAGEGFSAGFAQSGELLEAWRQYRAGTANAKELVQAFGEFTPFIPLVWRHGTAYTAKQVSGMGASLSNLFYDFGTGWA